MDTMTTSDAELNRLVAERVMGYKLINGGGAGPLWETPEGRWLAPRNYCTDPEAWGALFVWLAERGYAPSLEYDGLGTYAVAVGKSFATTVSPGRALVLATLAAYGVEVE